MRIARTHLMIALTLAVSALGFSAAPVSAHEGHDHGAMAKSEKKIATALGSLSAEDQRLAAAQRFCPIMTYDRLGSTGTPLKVTIGGKPVFLCCKGCVKDAVAGGTKTLKTVDKLTASTLVLAKLPMEERNSIEAQKYCAIANTSFLGSMGAPIKLDIGGKPVYLCCSGCTKKAQANPAAVLAKVEKLKQAGQHKDHGHGDHKHGDHKH